MFDMVPTCFYFFFFFSSRRRHTRLQGDWSSDVCSSDLLPRGAVHPTHGAALRYLHDPRDLHGRQDRGRTDQRRGTLRDRPRLLQGDRAWADCRRSEEHTSELQSPCNLVCRLLLEKKNNKITSPL